MCRHFITTRLLPRRLQAHVVARTNTGKTVRVSYWASKIGKRNVGWANGTVDSGPAFTLSIIKKGGAYGDDVKVVDDVALKMGYSSLHVTNPEFEVVVTPKGFCDNDAHWCGARERSKPPARLELACQPCAVSSYRARHVC